MALSEQKVLYSVTHNVVTNSFEVKWLNEILRDGEVISSTPHRASYSIDQKGNMSLDLGVDAEKYFVLAGW